MLRFTARALAACVSIAAFTLLAPTAAAEFGLHPRQGVVSIGGPEDDPDGFGAAVAIRSGFAFIGAPELPPGGKVVFYTATPTALIGTGIMLSPSEPVPSERFGSSLLYRDGVLLVGSNQATYVFKRNSSGVWNQKQKLPPSGAFRHEDGTLALGVAGGVNIYLRNTAGQFILSQKLVSPDSAPHNVLGDISMAGPTIVVGGNGRAYVFKRNSTGVWRHRQTLIPSEFGTEGAPTGFGSAVAIDRGMIIVSAPDFRDLVSSEGAAYGFVLDGALYVETFKLKPQLEGYSGSTPGFGLQILMFGARIVVHAITGISTDCDGWEESAFSYTREGSSVLPRGVASWNGCGASLALADDRLLVGIPRDFFLPEPGHANLYRLNVFE